jgi:hypothetical protein
MKPIQIRQVIKNFKNYCIAEPCTRVLTNSDAAHIDRGNIKKVETITIPKRVLIVDDDPDITLTFRWVWMVTIMRIEDGLK